MIATLQNNVPVVELLLQDGRANPNVSDRQGTTALMLAALANRTRIIPLILAAGGDPYLENGRGECACMHAIKSGHMEAYKQIARLLYMPLHDTCNKGPRECISRKMLQACLRYNQTEMFRSCLNLGIAWEILRRFKHISSVDDHGLSKYLESPNKHLMLTLRWGSGVLEEVMRYTTDINYQSKTHGDSTVLIGSICFSYRTRKGSLIDMIHTLLDAGADVTVANMHGLTAFHYAIYRREPEALEYLITACSERILEAFSYSYPQQRSSLYRKDLKEDCFQLLHGLELTCNSNMSGEWHARALLCL
eukprot:jgi/Picre1/34653/NNA_002121.t1